MKNNDLKVQGQSFLVNKGSVQLSLWRKRIGKDPLPILLLVHGSSLSSVPTFDLHVPGKDDYSMMDWFVHRGFDVWTLDHEGYGSSSVTDGNSDIATGVQDLDCVTSFILNNTKSNSLLLYGLSSGALRAGAFANEFPDRVKKIVLDAFVWTGKGSFTLAKRKEGLDFYRNNSRRSIDENFIHSLFLRDGVVTSEPEVMQACATAQLSYSNSVPTGTYLDMTCNLPLVDPTKLIMPTLIVRGEFDGIATMDDLLKFFELLATNDKQFTVIPNVAHFTVLSINRVKIWEIMKQFFHS